MPWIMLIRAVMPIHCRRSWQRIRQPGVCPAVYFHKGVISGLNTLLTAIIAIFVFGTFILIHEFGHFIAAKKFGVKVNEFAIGMGPTVWSTQKGETTYALRALRWADL